MVVTGRPMVEEMEVAILLISAMNEESLRSMMAAKGTVGL